MRIKAVRGQNTTDLLRQFERFHGYFVLVTWCWYRDRMLDIYRDRGVGISNVQLREPE